MNKITYNYQNLSPFKWYVLENFPFIEADFDAITEWQLFCKLGNEMNKIIDSVNLTGEQVETLTTAFNNLQNYVNNYFDNLDVQEEVNNKLNQMVTDGTLAQIINETIFNELNEKISENTLNISKNTTDIELLNSEKTIVIGDSYAGTNGDVTGWQTPLQTLLKLNDENYIKLSEPRCRFYKIGVRRQYIFVFVISFRY